MKGVINLNKPKGWTSRDAVNKVRGILHVKELGHMGTLDPQGEGVLPIGVGKATRLFDAMLKKDKVYEAEFAFGYETDTLDGDGKTLSVTSVIPEEEQLRRACSRLVGKVSQLPPAYSAKNVGGARAYELARKGISFELKPAEIEIYSLELVKKTMPNTYLFRIHCSAGTYIRSICRDLAHLLDSLATMVSIKRLRAGSFTIEKSITVDELALLGERALVPLETALSDFPRYNVCDERYRELLNGVKLDADDCPPAPFTVYCKNELFGLGEVIDGKLKIKTYLRD